MIADKRKVSTDALETLGTIIGPEEKRDAIHLAVIPAVAAHSLKPGMHVGLVNGHASVSADEHVGIVDPFLDGTIKKGQWFWLVIYPRKITSLRHVWSHPAFPEEAVMADKPAVVPTVVLPSESEQWLRSYAITIDESYEDLIAHAREFAERGEYWCEGEKFEGEYLPDQFWEHYEEVTGTKVKNKWSFFSCSC